MLILRIKQAETALADGRLDEAYELLKAQELRRHQRGQKLMGKLSRALAERGQNHLVAGRLQQALTDSNKAQKLGGNLPQIAQLKKDISIAIEEKQHNHHRRSLKLAYAKKHIDNGQVSVGEQILSDDNSDSKRAELLLEKAVAIRTEINVTVSNAQKALQRHDLEEAINIVLKTDANQRQSPDLSDLIATIISLSIGQITESLNTGRIDQGRVLLEKLTLLAPQSSKVKELSNAFTQCLNAAHLIADGRPREAVQIFQKLKTIFPLAKWLDAALDQAKVAAESLDALRTGPVGLVYSDAGEHIIESANTSKPTVLKSEGKENLKSSEAILKPLSTFVPRKFVLQIDGVGSFLVFRDKIITIGPISSSERPSLGLLADPHLPVASIERTEDDYFIHSENTVYVNDKPLTKKLLADGDRIALSNRCRLKFHLPNAASSTATLMLSGVRVPRPDISHIILMNREILIGPGSNYHVRNNGGADTLTLFVQNDELYCRAKDPILINSRVFNSGKALPVNTTIKIGQISLVLAVDKDDTM